MRVLRFLIFIPILVQCLFLLTTQPVGATYSPEADCSDGCDDAGEYTCGSTWGADDMCCTGDGCNSYACADLGYSPVICGGSWTCCVLGNCTKTCGGKLLDLGTCSFCPAEEECETSSPAKVTLSTPADDTVFVNKSTIDLGWNTINSWGENCDDNNVKKYKVQVDSGTGWADLCTVNHPSSSCAFIPDQVTSKVYSWRVISDNGAESTTSDVFSFTNNTTMTLTVRTQEVSYTTSACPGTSLGILPGVNITVSLLGTDKTYTGKTESDGSLVLPIAYSTNSPPQMTICSTYSGAMCQSYNVVCAGSTYNPALQTCVTVGQNTASTTQTVTVQMGKVKKDPWVAVVDGDAYARNFTSLGPCSSETQVLGGFYGGMLNLNKLSLGGNIYSLTLGSSTFPEDISEGTGGGYARNINVAEGDAEEIKIPETAKTMTNLGGYIRPDVYKMSVTDFNNSSGLYYFLRSGVVEVPNAGTTYETRANVKCYPGDMAYWPGLPGDCSTNIKLVTPMGCTSNRCYFRNGNVSPRVGYIYVAGNPSETLVIDSPIRGVETAGMSTAPGTVVIMSKARVKIDSALATPLASYTIDSPPQIEAVIISSTGIEIGSSYTEATPDSPVIFYGSLISTKSGVSKSKGVQILRDLGLDNNTYPSVVVNYPLDMLDRVNKSIKFNSKWGTETGLEVFDVRYEFDNAGETAD